MLSFRCAVLCRRGILIEPAPQNYRRLVRNRPDALTLNLAVCDLLEQVHLIDQGAVGGIYGELQPWYCCCKL